MATRRPNREDPIERAFEAALQPGRFISYGAGYGFVSDLEEVASEIENIVRTDGARAARLYETFIAGCYEKAEEIDDSGGNLGMFAESLRRVRKFKQSAAERNIGRILETGRTPSSLAVRPGDW